MSWAQVEANWSQVKRNLQAHWAKLTDQQLDVIDGKRERLIGRIHVLYGLPRTEVEKAVAQFEQGGFSRSWE